VFDAVRMLMYALPDSRGQQLPLGTTNVPHLYMVLLLMATSTGADV